MDGSFSFMPLTPVEGSATERLYTHHILFTQSPELLELLGY